MTFYSARQRTVRAQQWFKAGDHEAILPGLGEFGVLDIRHAAGDSRRYVAPGDWIVNDGSGKLSIVTATEFARQFEAVA